MILISSSFLCNSTSHQFHGQRIHLHSLPSLLVLKNLYFDSFLLICASFILKTSDIVGVIYHSFVWSSKNNLVNGLGHPYMSHSLN